MSDMAKELTVELRKLPRPPNLLDPREKPMLAIKHDPLPKDPDARLKYLEKALRDTRVALEEAREQTRRALESVSAVIIHDHRLNEMEKSLQMVAHRLGRIEAHLQLAF
jgi:hypothetical protein